MLPVRSTTAAASVSSPSAVAAVVSTARTSSAVRICAAPPTRPDGVFWERSAEEATRMRTAAAARDLLSRTRPILPALTRPEPFAVAAAESGAVPRLIVVAIAHGGLIPGVGGLQLSLSFEIPVPRFVLAAGLQPLDAAPIVAGAIRRVLLRRRRDAVLELRAREAAVVSAVETIERGRVPVPLAALDDAVVVDVETAELVGRRVLVADRFRAGQHAVAIGVERGEHRRTAVPLVAADAPVVVGIQIAEAVLG